MKKTISVIMASIMLFCSPTGAYAGGFLDKVGSTLGSAGQAIGGARDWVVENGGNAVSSAGEAIGEAKDWIIINGGNTINSAGEAIGSAWEWATENGSRQLAGIGATITEKWNDIFGNADESGPHHLCVSSPLFQTSDLLESKAEDDGWTYECFEFNDVYEITVLSMHRGVEDQVLFFGQMPATEVISTLYENVEFSQELASGGGKRAIAQLLSFDGKKEEKDVIGRAECVWTDHYSVIVIVSTEKDVEERETESNDMFDLWMNTLSIYETKENPDITETKIEAETDDAKHPFLTGILTPSNVKSANRFYNEYKFHNPDGGHGFAAEQANTLAENIKGVFTGEHAKVIGDDFVKNGADRKITLSDGTEYQVQTKYHRTAQSTIASCFDNDKGTYRYYNADGSPMQVEVPSDQYDEAVRTMEKRIREGK